ncbi:hypothetical protein PHYBLDRAFT_146919 [Phycomyces blakesleeanus NRRL 1555(-)]|uniref:DUF4218 domain-containing protein n=1 Tax=Phycomyces blakesleeanus (strain ATCC 8743b / DSM 1359 / FGSC 10004 / NBRC 33097 / NRRL 1555) TaxID=763407 RepID=A0A162X181_PHYB8|nr:hypothetical protein PHYBLDRAFT_146919 [Phycomyces blakesleeanus NRRL 1555(-)]OAD71935.1 hypothetical protein PHYBLDRAFT_146919 [Phycomyces blakesleeanus NRRL 1555(-)]|eukprot:XP_018289975.1 hypothetical protein PHYBLDRAFT_146919 [Phycomyces blakesleeanus NRRL 1555(-)]
MKNNDLLAMQTVAATMILPSNYTKLKTKIGKSFSHMKADDWIHYIKACCILVKPSISFIEIDQAHRYLQEFCQSCEDTYEPKVLTCNMHLHLHLYDTICDFGPVYGYSLFGFERYNGLLKNNKTNRKDGFKTTYMTKFTADAYKADYIQNTLSCPSLIPFLPLFEKLTSTTKPITTYATYASTNQQPFQLQQFSLKESTMSDIDYPQLLDYYKIVYVMPNLISYHDARLSQYFVNNQITKLKSIDLLGQTYIGNNSSEVATAVDVTDMNEERMLVIPMPKNTMSEAFISNYAL